jgi:transposase
MANRKIDMCEYKNVIQRLRHGESDRQICRETNLGRRKIKEIHAVSVTHGWLMAGVDLPCDESISQLIKKSGNALQVSKASLFDGDITAWLSQGATANRIYQKLVDEQNFEGHYSSVQRYVRKLRNNAVKLTSPLDFKMGEAAQVDFGKGPDLFDERTKRVESTWFFVMTLCWSRHQYAVLVTHQDVETWLTCHQQAFEWFGGVVNKVIIDNAKCAITKACYYEPEVQRSYEAFASTFGFIISACPPRDPQKKGRVESGVKYIKQNFLSLSEFNSLQAANNSLKTWVLEKAGKRIHGSTFKKPLDEFNQTEKKSLKPLPSAAYEITRWYKTRLYKDCHIRFEKNRYSAPHHYYSHELWLKVSPTLVMIFNNHQLIATHPKLHGDGQISTILEHMPPQSQAYHTQDSSWCTKKAKEIGPLCLEVVMDLLTHPTSDLLRAAQGVIRLKTKYGAERLEKACFRAMAFHSASYKAIKAILEKKLDEEAFFDDTVPADLSSIYRGHAENQRQPLAHN